MASTNVGSIHYDLSLETSKFDNAIENIHNKTRAVGDRMTSIGKTMTMGLTLPIVAGAGFAIKAASDLNETMNKVDVAFKDQAATVKAWGQTSITAMGLAKQSAFDAAALFGDMATGMGLNTEQSAKMSMGLTQLGADLASFKNISFDRAQIALAGVFTGETEALKGLGIVMTEANLAAFAQSQGIKKSVESMTQAEKVQLRYAYVMSVTKNAQGDFARTAGGTANQIRITQERLKELSATMGQALLPLANSVLATLQQWMNKLTQLTPAQQRLGFIIAGVVAALGPFLILLGSLITAISVLATPVGLVVAGFIALTAAIGYLQIKFNFVQRAVKELLIWFKLLRTTAEEGVTSSGFHAFLERIGLLIEKLKPVIKFIRITLVESFQDIISIGRQLSEELEPLARIFKRLGENDQLMTVLKYVGMALAAIALSPIIGAFALLVGALKLLGVVLNFVANNFDLVKNIVITTLAVAFWPITAVIAAVVLVVRNFGNAIEWLGNTFNNIKTTVQNTLSQWQLNIVNAFNSMRNFIVGIWQAMYQDIVGKLTAIWNFISPFLNFIKNVFIIVFGSILIGIIVVFTSIYNVIATAMTAAWNVISAVANAIFSRIVSVFNAIFAVVSPILNMLAGAVINTFTAIYNIAASIVISLYNFMASAWGSMVGLITGIIGRLIGFFSGAFGWLYGAGQSIVAGLASGISSAAGAAWGAIKAVADQIGRFFAGAGGWLFGVGVAIVQGLANGIGSAAGAVYNKAEEIANTVKNKFKDALSIKSPSRVFYGYGQDIAQGLANGLAASRATLTAAVNSLSNATMQPIFSAPAAVGGQAPNISSNTTINGDITIGSQDDARHFFARQNRNTDLLSLGLSPIGED